MAFFDDIGREFERAANDIAREADRLARAAAAEAERAAREADRQAAAAAAEAERLRRETERLAQVAMQQLGRELRNVTVVMSSEVEKLNRDIGREVSRFGGDAERAANQGELTALMQQAAQQFVNDNQQLVRKVAEFAWQIQRSRQVLAEVNGFANDLSRGIPKTHAQAQRLIQRANIDGLIDEIS